ncbi:cytochrome c oxidase subunit 7A2, mitochondrial-like isoform X2 [Acanthaster planci]|uniref:Cytochrome c oxidase subunit 7A2, mitochondrial-like isoform X2 n=1 Tax=Acanthaster planci TaxID=133434 RepID=A0A8B7YCL3_ACAPL|nr:cytochrome c oxidase subunit 7A2, mitochondrial-like isoform X2 [Acanthaster planci]
MNRALILRSLLPRARASFSTTTRSQIQNKVKENQLRFQKDDGLPVHLKGGLMDTFSYTVIMGLTVAGTAWVCYELFTLSMPKK